MSLSSYSCNTNIIAILFCLIDEFSSELQDITREESFFNIWMIGMVLRFTQTKVVVILLGCRLVLRPFVGNIYVVAGTMTVSVNSTCITIFLTLNGTVYESYPCL